MSSSEQTQNLDGRVGHLTDQQESKLKDMWKKFLSLTREGESPIAGVQADKSAAASSSSGEKGGKEDGEDALKKKPKDDNAASAQEKKEMSALLGTHGSQRFHEEFWKFARGENPDALMLRFLRARKWDVDRGFMMLAAAIKWRIEEGVMEIQEKGEERLCEEEGFQLQYDKGKSYIHGTDRNDRPVVYIHVAKHKPKEQSQKSLERFTIFNMETARHLMAPPVEQGTLVFDMTGFGLANMDWACVSFIVKCFEAYYPETLGLCCIHKAPFVFWGIWKMLGPLLDPVVRSKIDFTKSDKDLAKHIDPAHLKKAMGGDLEWEWSYSGPIKGENAIQEDEAAKKEKLKLYDEACKNWEDLTDKWINGDKAAGEKRQDEGIKLFKIRYLDLDPYVRGKTVYARESVNVGDGTVKWDYSGKVEKFGTSADDWRKELGLEGQCPRYGVSEEEQVVQTQNGTSSGADGANGDSDPTERSGPRGVFAKIRRKTGDAVSVVTPGPSNAEKREEEGREAQEAEEKRKAEEAAELARKKKEEEEEEAKKKEEEQKEQEEKSKSWANGDPNTYLGSAQNTVANAAQAVQNGTASALNTTGETLKPYVNAAADYVPAAIGGEKLKEVTAGNGQS